MSLCIHQSLYDINSKNESISINIVVKNLPINILKKFVYAIKIYM
jgi:hypothetical protein